MTKGFAGKVTGKNNDIYEQITSFAEIIQNTFEAEIKSDALQALIKSREHYDLLILEACVKPVLIFSHIFKAPLILFSSIPTYGAINEYTGTESHPLLFPSYIHQKINNLTMWEKAKEIYKHYYFESLLAGKVTDMGDRMLRRIFGNDIPPLNSLAENVDMVFLTEHHIWDSNRPPSVIYVGGIYPPENQTAIIPEDILTFLDSSKTGVIYVSLGTNVKTSLLPQETVNEFMKVFLKIAYDVLLRWCMEFLKTVPDNVKVVKWVPQTALLKHPKIRLFITQGGLQSVEDAINAGVPMIGMPMLADQWFNVEQCLRLKIGVRLDIESITEENMLAAIESVTRDVSYRSNIRALRDKVHDQPQTALERAVWWSEYVIRHKGARHLRAPTALISYWDYFEGDLLSMVALWSSIAIIVLGLVIHGVVVICQSLCRKIKVD